MKRVLDQLRSGDGEGEQAEPRRDAQELWPRALLWSGYSRVHGPLLSESATSPAAAGLPLPRGSQTRTESEPLQSTLGFCVGLDARNIS